MTVAIAGDVEPCAGDLGYANPLVEFPELSTLIIAFNMALPMAIWMRFRRMAWAPVWEMSAAMFALAILLIAAFWLGLITAGPRGLFGWQHGLMLPAMVIPMLFRLDVYTGRVGHTASTNRYGCARRRP